MQRLSPDAAHLVAEFLRADRRVLLFGQPGVGKSTLAARLGEALTGAGRPCACIGADPGSPPFDVPGALSLGAWDRGRWQMMAREGLASLDAGRFRLPVVAAVRRLAAQAPPGTLLVDGPGVVRGIAGAELLWGLVEAARVDLVLALARGEQPPLAAELAACGAEVRLLPVVAEAHRPGKRSRARARTALWDAYLAGGSEARFSLDSLTLLGAPPPPKLPAAWHGRQVVLLDGAHTTLCLGEVVALEEGDLRLRLPPQAATGPLLLVRDAQRTAGGLLESAPPPGGATRWYRPPPDLVPGPPAGADHGGPRPVLQVGPVNAILVNGVFGDPLLHLRLRHQRRSLLFDLGEASRLPARIAHQVSDCFISHAHFDHIGGFPWLLRSRIGVETPCRIYGPPGITDHVRGFINGVRWDRIGDRGPRFEVYELMDGRLRVTRLQVGRPEEAPAGERTAVDGVLLEEPGFRVRAATLDHGIPVLAFAFEPGRLLQVRKERLIARGLAPGPWLGELKARLAAEQGNAPIHLPDGTVESAGALGEALICVGPVERLVYATDLADSPENRARLIELAAGAHTLVCEAAFAEADCGQAAATRHLTAHACGEIAVAARVEHLIPFHLSRRYETDPGPLFDELRSACPQAVLPR